MSLPTIVTRDEWLAARKQLLTREKELTRERDAINAARRRLPMVEITEDYRFEGPDGEVGLLDLFDGRRQLLVYHFMWLFDEGAGCPSCSFLVDNVGHLNGWGTPEQIRAVEEADAAVGIVLRALRESGTLDSTLILLTADHGGAARTHAPDDPRSRHIPWIAAGPGIRRNFDLTRYAELNINTEDTFATASYLLNIPIDEDIDGKAVLQVLEELKPEEEMLFDESEKSGGRLPFK